MKDYTLGTEHREQTHDTTEARMPTRKDDALVVALVSGAHTGEDGAPFIVKEGHTLRASDPIVTRNPQMFADAGLTSTS